MKGWDYGSLCLDYKWTGWENDRLNERFGLGQTFERVSLSDLNGLCDFYEYGFGRDDTT